MERADGNGTVDGIETEDGVGDTVDDNDTSNGVSETADDTDERRWGNIIHLIDIVENGLKEKNNYAY